MGILDIASIDETIEYLLENQCSVARFGDGEMCLMTGEGIGFQAYDERLAARLKEVLISKVDPQMMICIPGALNDMSLLNEQARTFWHNYLSHKRIAWYRQMDTRRRYGDAHMTRLYIDYKDKVQCKEWFSKIRQCWENREILIVEGKMTRFGVGNDLLSNAHSIQRILAPAVNAFAKYEELLEVVRKLGKNKLVLIALGPTATVLAYDLHQLGFWAIDIGHLDIEYEWFIHQASQKVPVLNKYVNEATGNAVSEIETDLKYNQQIIFKVH